jgi:predicted nuclease of restriction endonuclease-like (RecB) superfamily
MKNLEQNAYNNFYSEVKAMVYKAQYEALKVVNKELINLYWSIGKSIVEKQDEYKWGKSVVETLAKDLQNEFPGIKGFSAQNLWYMRQFFKEYNGHLKLQPLVGEIAWSKHLMILSKCKVDQEREFYIKMTKKYGWSKSVLIHQIEGKAFERTMLGQSNFDTRIPENQKKKAKLALKDSYSFDFLELGVEHSEHELELALIKNIRKFLLEMGGDFAFIGNQFKLQIGDDAFYIDLLLYHRKLQSLVAIELKTTKFLPEYSGKMQFYLTALDEEVKAEHENPSIGIIICKSKNRTVVEYALKRVDVPIGVASYNITNELPDNLKSMLPSSEEIAAKLEDFFD